MIRTTLYSPASGEIRQGDASLIDDWESSGDALLWVDLCGTPDAEERDLMQARFGLHPLAVQDAVRDRHPPKIEEFDDSLLILLKGLRGDAGEFEFGTIQLAAFLGERFLLTRRSGQSASTDQLWHEVSVKSAVMAGGLNLMLLRLCRIMVGRYVNKILALEERLAEIEEEMLSKPNDELLAELVGYKTSLNKYRRVFIYHTQIFDELRVTPPKLIGTSLSHEVNDVYEQQERVASLAGLYYEIAADLIDGYISVASHRLNNIVRVLTIITVVFVPLSFLAGVYGMNFEYIPELGFRYGYFTLLGTMGLIASVLLYFFRKKHWL